MRKKLCTTIIVLCSTLIVLGQSPNSARRFRKYFLEIENFGISKIPITNRHYITYLCWNISVYGKAFPQKIVSLLPQEKINFHDSQSFESLLSNPGTLLNDYILNPNYIDYPITGLNLHQVMEMEKWLSDRYNEYILLMMGYLNFTPDQMNSDCFVLESYLTGQYTGSVRNGKIIYWKENKFLPSFRLPDQSELGFLYLNIKDSSRIKKYKNKLNHFLAPWEVLFIQEKKGVITLRVNKLLELNLEGKLIEINKYIDLRNTDAALPDKEAIFINRKYFDDVDYEEKDLFGKMRFLLIGENSSNRPIVAIYNTDQENVKTENKIYRIAYNKIIYFKYWP